MADLVRLENLRKGRLFRIWDIPIFAILLALIVAMLLFVFLQDKGSNVEIYVNGQLTHVITLSEDSQTEIVSEDGKYSLILHVKNGEAYVSDATCEDKICQYSMHIKRVHSQIVCSPARIVIRVVGDSDIDGVVTG